MRDMMTSINMDDLWVRDGVTYTIYGLFDERSSVIEERGATCGTM